MANSKMAYVHRRGNRGRSHRPVAHHFDVALCGKRGLSRPSGIRGYVDYCGRDTAFRTTLMHLEVHSDYLHRVFYFVGY